METDALNIFGVHLGDLALTSGYVYFLVELIKNKFSNYLTGGVKTQIIALLISFGFAIQMYYPDWTTLIISGLAIWLIPEAIHQKVKGTN